MSRTAIAAALARADLVSGERLVVFSLASFADRDGRARPATPTAAQRAGLRKSWYLEIRDRLVGRGLVIVEAEASGRGRASTLALPFTADGPWWEGDINAELFETVLGYSRAHGPARLLLAAMGALAEDDRVVRGLATERLCAAAGLADRTYRRARAALLASGELVLRSGIGGRGKTNLWEIADPRSGNPAAEPVSRRRAAPPSGARPLMAVNFPRSVVDAEQRARAGEAGDSAGGRQLLGVKNGVKDRTVSEHNRPAPAGVLDVKGGQERTVCRRQTPAQTPAETPAPDARVGREPQNHSPPQPPSRGESR